MLSKKKVLYVITKSNFGGAQRYVHELATSLPKEDFDVVVAAGGNGPLQTKLEHAGIRTVSIQSFERDINIFKEISAMFELSRLIRKERPDVIHLNSSKAGGSGAFVARLHRVPHIIFTAHGWPFFEKRSLSWRALAWFFSWLTALLAHKVIVVSAHDFMRHRMPWVQKKISLIHPGVPFLEWKERDTARHALFPSTLLEKHAHDLWVVTTSEHNHNKNLETALEAVHLYNVENTRKIFLTLIGEGERRRDLERYAETHGIQDAVFFSGYVDDARSYLKAFDVFLLPSLKEGLPYALLEAGAAGLFCIASNVGGIPDVIDHAVNGYLVKPQDTGSIVKGFGAYDPHVNLQTKIVSEFALKNMLEKTQSLYI